MIRNQAVSRQKTFTGETDMVKALLAKDVEEVFHVLIMTPKGIGSGKAKQRFREYKSNELKETKKVTTIDILLNLQCESFGEESLQK